MEQELKVWPEFFKEIVDGRKTFEVRKNDRDFKVGDILLLAEWVDGHYTGMCIKKEVTYILQGGQFGIEEGYVVMGIV